MQFVRVNSVKTKLILRNSQCILTAVILVKILFLSLFINAQQIDSEAILGQASIDDVPLTIQNEILTELRHSSPNGRFLTTYQVRIIREDSLSEIAHFFLNLFPDLSGVKQLLSNNVSPLLHRRITTEGANCWNTAIAALASDAWPMRYMGPEEFNCHLENFFEPVIGQKKWGDIARFIRIRGAMDVHSAVYLGNPVTDPTRELLLSKNGPEASFLLVMDHWETKNWLYPGTYSKFYRLRTPGTLTNPAFHTDHPCRGAYLRHVTKGICNNHLCSAPGN